MQPLLHCFIAKPRARLKQTGFLLFTAKRIFLKNFIKKVNR